MNHERNCQSCLSGLEREKILPSVISFLRKTQDYKSALNERELCELIAGKGYGISESRMRRLIAHIRIHNHLPRLVRSPNGYYCANDETDVVVCIAELEESALVTMDEASALKKQINFQLQ